MTSEQQLTFGDFQFDPATGDLRGPSGLVQLTPKALELLGYLTARPGRLVTKQELLDALWPDVFVTDGVLKVCVREIRRALGDDAHTPKFIETAHRRGYRFIAPIQRADAVVSGRAASAISPRASRAVSPPASAGDYHVVRP